MGEGRRAGEGWERGGGQGMGGRGKEGEGGVGEGREEWEREKESGRGEEGEGGVRRRGRGGGSVRMSIDSSLVTHSTPKVNILLFLIPRLMTSSVGASSVTCPSDTKNTERGGSVLVSAPPTLGAWSESRCKEWRGLHASVVPMVAQHC